MECCRRYWSISLPPSLPLTEHPSCLNERTAQVPFSIAQEIKIIFFSRERHLSSVGTAQRRLLENCEVFGLATETVAITAQGCLTVVFKYLVSWYKCFFAPVLPPG